MRWGMNNDALKNREERILFEIKECYPEESSCMVGHELITPFDMIIEMDDGRYMHYDSIMGRMWPFQQEGERLGADIDSKRWSRTFGRILERNMQIRGYYQKTFAEDLGVSQGTVSNWIRGKAMPNAYTLRKIEMLLNCTFDDLDIYRY